MTIKKEYNRIISMLLSLILVLSSFTSFSYAKDTQSITLPFEKILNGNDELKATYLGEKTSGTSKAQVLLAKSVKDIDDFKMIMEKSCYAVTDITQEKLVIDPSQFYDPYDLPEDVRNNPGGSFDEATKTWHLTLLKERCKIDNINSFEFKQMKQFLGSNYHEESTYYGVFIPYLEENKEVFYYLYIEVGEDAGTVSKVHEPTSSHPDGTYSNPIDVTLKTNTEGATILYTLNDTEPTINSMKYTNPIHLSKDTTLRAIAVKDGLANSAELKVTFSFATQGDTPKLENGVYQIETAAQLVGFQEIVSRASNSTETRAGIKAKLVNDIDMKNVYLNKGWSSFYGDFDGNGKKLFHMDISSGTKLFTQNYGIVRNLGFETTDTKIMSSQCCAVCVYNNGTIENCYIKGNLNIEMGTTGGSIGGLTAINESTGKILNSHHEGEIIVTRGNSIGGLCAYNGGLIDKCWHKGNITVSNLEKLESTEIGGLAGNNFSTSKRDLGTIQNSYSIALLHNTGYWGFDMYTGAQYYGNWAGAAIFSLVGNNNRNSSSDSEQLGTVTDSYYLDYIPTVANQQNLVKVDLSRVYRAYAGKSTVAGWECEGVSPFVKGNEYYAYYDTENDHFIVVGYSDTPSSPDGVINAKKPSETKATCSLVGPQETPTKDFYLVTVPKGTKNVTFQNTTRVVDYTMGMNNTFFEAYNVYAHSSYQNRTMLSGTPVTYENVNEALEKAKASLSEEGYKAIEPAFSVMRNDIPKKEDTSDKINVSFRIVGATKSASGEYDAKTNKDSQYVTWLATRSYSLEKGSTVNDLLETAAKNSGMKTIGAENGYVSAVYAPSILGNYYLGEFTNGKYSGWMYTVNGKHPSIALNAYILKNSDTVIWHYINDYRYECSDWFKGDADYPNLGDESTWDPWLKVPDVDPTADTPTTGVEKEDKKVTTDNKSEATSSPTEVAVSNKTNADGTVESTATVTVKKENQEEIIKQAKENKSKDIVLNVEASDSKGADNIQLELPKDMINSIVKETEATVTVKSEQGELTIDKETLAQISKDAKGTAITVIISKMKTATEEQKKLTGESTTVYKLTVMSGNEVISQFNGKITVKLPIPAVLLDKTVAAVHFDGADKFTVMDGKRVSMAGAEYYAFDTTHFSEFGLVDAKEAGIATDDSKDDTDKLDNAAKVKKAKKITSKMKLTTVTTKTKKKNVKVNVKMTKTTKTDIHALKKLGYNVKYSFYRSTKKGGTYTLAATKKANTYTYLKGKKAKRYYYKTQIRVYDKKGKLITKTTLKNSKYASKIWAK